MRRAFTLIELLIVVAIIGILAAIAVPNFINAQVRAKISRVASDYRGLRTAMDVYQLDYNNYPPNGALLELTKASHVFRILTTPVAYHSGPFSDPFQQNKRYRQSFLDGTYLYALPREIKTNGHPWRITWYRLMSFGPDQIYDPTYGETAFDTHYHPSNGIISRGDIVYTSDTGELNFEF